MEIVWVFENTKKSHDWNSRLNFMMLFASVSLWRKYNPTHYTVLYVDSHVKEIIDKTSTESLWHEVREFNDNYGKIDKLSFWSSCKTKIISEIKVPTLMVDHDSLIFRNMDEYIGDSVFYAYDEKARGYYPEENDVWNKKLKNPIEIIVDRAANVSLLYFNDIDFAHRYANITLENHIHLSSLNNFNTNANYMILSEQLMLRQMLVEEKKSFFPLCKNIWDCSTIGFTENVNGIGKWDLKDSVKYYKHYGLKKGKLKSAYSQRNSKKYYDDEYNFLKRCINAGGFIDSNELDNSLKFIISNP
jgi:hypothetical protein